MEFMDIDVFLNSLWIGLGALCISLVFLIIRTFRLTRENRLIQADYRLALDNWMRECERRAIAEEKASRLFEMESRLQQKSEGIEKLLFDQSHLKSQLAEKEMQLKQQLQFEEEKLVLLQQAQLRLTETFKVVSSEALNHNIHSFLELATARFEKLQDGAKLDLTLRQQAIDHMVKPIHTCLQTVDQKMAELEKSRLMAYSSLTEQVNSLAKSQTLLQSETANLVKALRMPQVRGR